jgi:hypothetical protein
VLGGHTTKRTGDGKRKRVAHAAFSLLRANARRRDEVREELSGLFKEMDAGKAIPTTDEDFARMVHDRAVKHSGQ